MASQFSDFCLAQIPTISKINDFKFRTLDIEQDMPTLKAWFNQEYAKFWGMQNLSLAAIESLMSATQHKFALIGEWQGKALFMLELYDPAHDEVGQHYSVVPGDCGMHLIIAPPDGQPISGLSFKVMDAIAQLVLEKLAFNRLVVEPDQFNSKIHRLNNLVGIRYEKAIQLSTKTAFLGFCTAADRLHLSNIPVLARTLATQELMKRTLVKPPLVATLTTSAKTLSIL